MQKKCFKCQQQKEVTKERDQEIVALKTSIKDLRETNRALRKEALELAHLLSPPVSKEEPDAAHVS